MCFFSFGTFSFSLCSILVLIYLLAHKTRLFQCDTFISDIALLFIQKKMNGHVGYSSIAKYFLILCSGHRFFAFFLTIAQCNLCKSSRPQSV